MTGFSWSRVIALSRKDAAELMRNPGAILPALLMVLGALAPAFMVIVTANMIEDKSLAETQIFLFDQFSLLLMLVPIVGSMALATHAVIGEKQSKALEPLLATPISTLELLTAKTLTPFSFSLVLSWISVVLYVLGAAVVGEPGVWQAVVSLRLVILFGLLGPLATLASLLVAVIVSSWASDPRSAQQISGLLIIPITGVFVAQLMGAFVVGAGAMLLACLGCALLNAVLFWLGIRVFARESILTRWR